MDIDESRIFIFDTNLPNINGYTLKDVLSAGFVDLYLLLCQYESKPDAIIMLSFNKYIYNRRIYNQVYINNITTNIYVW